MIMTEEVEGGIRGMCNLGEGLIEKYEARGEAKKSREIAERMLERNISVEDISACTDLTIEEILELKKK